MLPFDPRPQVWNHNTSTAWFVECSQKGSDVVLYGDFSTAWENDRVLGELDEFRKLILIPCVGERYKDMLERDSLP